MVRRILIATLFTALLSSCSTLQGLRGHLQEQEPRYVVHTVQFRGETLSLISLWYTGSLKNWKLIQRANPGIDVQNMQLSSQILIPGDIAIKDRAFRKQELASLLTRTAKTSTTRKDLHLASYRSADSVVEESNSEFYPVQSITGCESFENSPTGLASCAELVDSRIALP